MTAAELVRYNLTRLIRESGRDPTDIALRAWPLSSRLRLSSKEWAASKLVRTRRLARYLAGQTDDRPGRPSLEALDDLARALKCKVSDFFREPAD
jgi:hypothetical protein